MGERDVVEQLMAATIAILAAVQGGGCSQGVEHWGRPVAEHKLEVTPVETLHPVSFAAGSSEIPALELQRLDRFIGEIARMDSGSVHVAAVTPDGTASAADRAERVAAYLRYRGLDPLPWPAGRAPEVLSADRVLVLYRDHLVTLPGCPDFSGWPGYNKDNLPSRNFGCATAKNLGVMVAEPSDLAHGRDPGHASGEYLGRGITAYRTGETAPFIGSGTQSESVEINLTEGGDS